MECESLSHHNHFDHFYFKIHITQKNILQNKKKAVSLCANFPQWAQIKQRAMVSHLAQRM